MIEKMILRFKKFIYYYFDLFHFRGKQSIQKTEQYNHPKSKDYPQSKYKLGIIKEKWNLHTSFVKACQEENISYVILDLLVDNWLDEIDRASFDFLIARPSVQYTVWKDTFDYRLKILSNSRNYKIYPDILSLWLWESKLKTIDWLKANRYSHPKTWIFYNKDEALQFAETYNKPLVYKANIGSGSSGIKIIESKWLLKKQIHKCFSKGVRTYRKYKLDKEHGYIILQEFIKDVVEWRIIRIGAYYFGFQKIKKGRFHSGSGEFSYGMPPFDCLDFVRKFTNENEFYFVDIDVFIDSNGTIFINEIQPYFGQKGDRELLIVDGESGRLHFEEKWKFEKGTFCKNNLSNLRLIEIIKNHNEVIN